MKASQQQPMTNQLSGSKRTGSKRTEQVAESQDMVMQSQNSNQLSARLKQVRHADQVKPSQRGSKPGDSKSMRSGMSNNTGANAAESDHSGMLAGRGRDSEDPTEDIDADGEGRMDVQDRDSNSRGSRRNQEQIYRG